MSPSFLRISRFALIIGLFSCSFAIPGITLIPVHAQAVLDPGFDPDRILEDEDIFDVNGMSYDRLVRFLRSKGTLADHLVQDIDGVQKPAVDVIWRVATSYKMNPKYLIAVLQKEQSLVEDANPNQRQFDWAMGYGVCDSCSKDDPAIQDYKGFASQLEWAAKQHREKYLLRILATGTTRSGTAPGKSMVIDGEVVTPQNNATAMLYAYTPHTHGNLNLWRIWRRWFSLNYPDGTVVKGKNSNKNYLIRLGQKRAFTSRAVLESMVDPEKIVLVSDTELAAYPDGPDIRFPKYALLKEATGTIWLLDDEGKRRIADMKAFHKFGFNEDEIIELDQDEDISEYPIGETISVKTEFPQGMLFTEKETKKLWYIEGSVKREVPHVAFLKLYFSGIKSKVTTTKKLASYTTGDPYRFHDGELVRGVKNASVYVVENGLLRPIPSAEIFESIGWKWKNVITVADSVIKSYDVGDYITLESVKTRATTQTTLERASNSSS
ncbi:hypothetical protein IT408_02025 [Candidatus Uhrbacteria bacterium]|nr:hypothetical protein [Candidatus Uhrbacteria bacterium]